ncbi:sigma-54 interaction domain-containing protein [Desulfoluna spongiiphila]|uniref:sigma-54 interaction domain-containing protein n=1 Tax=Desulfoluna spongiiphila TaxID=419481 RepID=UPI001254265A|nr:sigma 54-interacting transcriptional regulator [Desulfoluna spongiiphila]VVS92162.1 pas fold [Desulfoluna spongiiphila]
MSDTTYEVPYFQEKYGHLFSEMDAILNVLHEGVCISNADGVILKMNPMYERLCGLPPEALLGKKVSFLNSKEGVFDEAEPHADRVEQKKGIFMGAVSPVILKSKRPASSVQQTSGGRKNLLHGYPVLNADGEVELVVTFIRDISHLTLFKEQIEYHKHIFQTFWSNVQHGAREVTAPDAVVVESPAMKQVMSQARKVAATDATVLILGDTGVGKGEVARYIHGQSDRSGSTFFCADCTSIPENLIESELFGYARGAFSGARREGKPGYFDIAAGGTIFLDEIGELSLNVQAKLLRVLQDQEIMQVGSLKPKKIDTRIIAATNVNLEEAVAKGTFRQDLYYRLQVSVLDIPPLKERREDIEPLARYFLERYNLKYRKQFYFSDDVVPVLLRHGWAGNVRELQNMIQGIVITLDKNVIEPEDFPRLLPKGAAHASESYVPVKGQGGKSLKEIMAEIEYDILKKAMETCHSTEKVAEMFRVNRTTVSRKLKAGKKQGPTDS